MLEAPVTIELILSTLKHMKKNKALGPDCVNVEFFLVTWHLTGDLFCEAVKHFFAHGYMHQGPNSSFIALVPKTASPSKMQTLDQFHCALSFTNVFPKL